MTILNFYQKPVILDRNAHRKVRLKAPSKGFSYVTSTIAVPLAPIEFPQAVAEFPIVFALSEDGPGMPIALMGLRENENLLVDESGKWLADYIPAFVRRYPFVLNIDPNNGAPMVLIDEAFDGINETEGEPLFAEDGTESPMLQSTLAFLGDFRQQSEHANQFMLTLKKHDLLVPQMLTFGEGGENSVKLEGFYIVDEKRLLALGDAALLELTRNGDLGRIYTHLLSLNNANRLIRRMANKAPAAAAA
ncbi:MAG: SapC family protein [Burkholderiaceae bacterium]|nr:SapC family protein [Burkholderiaceae bacterium]